MWEGIREWERFRELVGRDWKGNGVGGSRAVRREGLGGSVCVCVRESIY